MTSEKFSLNDEDFKKVVKNAIIFLAPALIVFLTAIQSGVDFKTAMGAVYLWGLNTSIDLLRKFVQER